jgi:predicted nucleic acid-binding protein
VGPHLAITGPEAARRQTRLQQVEAAVEMLAFDPAAARSYGQMMAAVAVAGRSRRRRIADLLIAATARANGLTLYTRNPDDFVGLEDLLQIMSI